MAERTALTVLREMAVVKAQVKNPELLSMLLAPLEAELAARARAVAGQGKLELGDPVEKASKKG